MFFYTEESENGTQIWIQKNMFISLLTNEILRRMFGERFCFRRISLKNAR